MSSINKNKTVEQGNDLIQLRVRRTKHKKVKMLAIKSGKSLQWMADFVVEKGLESLKQK